jgi:hypothetical protein
MVCTDEITDSHQGQDNVQGYNTPDVGLSQFLAPANGQCTGTTTRAPSKEHNYHHQQTTITTKSPSTSTDKHHNK